MAIISPVEYFIRENPAEKMGMIAYHPIKNTGNSNHVIYEETKVIEDLNKNKFLIVSRTNTRLSHFR